ncbi:MAG: IS1 family transposase [Spirulinaceae cyanobacterium]
MKCPECNSSKVMKNGHRRGKQCYKCRQCSRQFVDSPKNQLYSQDTKQLCLKMYANGMSLRGIERVTNIHHTTIMNWIKEAEIELPNISEEDEISEIKKQLPESLQFSNL